MIGFTAVECIERWMYEHRRTAIIVMCSSLVAIGIIIGLVVTTNIYDHEMTQMFERAAITGKPVMINDELYWINKTDPFFEQPLIWTDMDTFLWTPNTSTNT